jgi:ribonuclease P protein component
MLPKKHRIQRKDFDRFFKKSKAYHTENMTIRISLLDEEKYTQCACVVSKKVSKSSPIRHLIRRRVYHILRDHLDNQPPRAIFVFMKKGAEIEFEPLRKDVENILSKAL